MAYLIKSIQTLNVLFFEKFTFYIMKFKVQSKCKKKVQKQFFKLNKYVTNGPFTILK